MVVAVLSAYIPNNFYNYININKERATNLFVGQISPHCKPRIVAMEWVNMSFACRNGQF